MFDPVWDVINGPEANAIEVLNYSSQVNAIEALARVILHHAGVGPSGCLQPPNENAFIELHRVGTIFLLKDPGVYRDCPVNVVRSDGQVVYTPPPADEVGGLMKGFFAELAHMWDTSEPLEVAAFCLWRINWIHPFKNGNGRTARAFSYLCLTLKYGFLLSGEPTVIDLVMANRPQYEDAIRAADQALKANSTYDCSAMKAFLTDLFVKQLSSIVSANP